MSTKCPVKSTNPSTPLRVTQLDIFPASRIKLSASPISVLLLLAYSPFGCLLAILRISIFLFYIFFSIIAKSYINEYLTCIIQKLLLLSVGIYVKVDGKLSKSRNDEKQEDNLYKEFMYISNWQSFVDCFILPVYLKAGVYRNPNITTAGSNRRNHQESNLMKLLSSPFSTETFSNCLYFPEYTPSTASAIIKWSNNTNFDSSNCDVTSVNFIPIFTRISFNAFVPLENCTIYSTPFSDLLVILFSPVTVFEVKACSPMSYKIREEETISSFILRLRRAQSEAGSVPLSIVTNADKFDLQRRYRLEESQAHLGMSSNSTRTRAASSNKIASAPISSKNLTDTQIYNQLKSIFGQTLSQDEIVAAYKESGNNYDKTIEILLRMAKKKENLVKEGRSSEQQSSSSKDKFDESLDDDKQGNVLSTSISWDENPIKAEMCLEERKVALYNYAKARFIHKYGGIKSKSK